MRTGRWVLGGALVAFGLAAARPAHAALPQTLDPHGLAVVSTHQVEALHGRSGSVTVSHDGPYGAVVGKATELEPTTGLSFDTPLEYRPR